MWQTILIILSFLVIFGSILYIVMHKLLHVWKDENVKPKKITLWLWRIALVMVLMFIIAIIFLNKNIFTSILLSGKGLASGLLIFTFVLFVSIIEIAIIDLLLPDIVKLWKRIFIETLCLVILVATTAGVFIIYQLTSF